jgi:hypothetical protein
MTISSRHEAGERPPFDEPDTQARWNGASGPDRPPVNDSQMQVKAQQTVSGQHPPTRRHDRIADPALPGGEERLRSATNPTSRRRRPERAGSPILCGSPREKVCAVSSADRPILGGQCAAGWTTHARAGAAARGPGRAAGYLVNTMAAGPAPTVMGVPTVPVAIRSGFTVP